MNTWMIGKSLMKHHYLKNFYSRLNMEDIIDADYSHGKAIFKDLETSYIMICMFKAVHYYQLMYLRALEICPLKCTNLILQNIFQLFDQHRQAAFKKSKVILDLLTNIDMLLMVEKGIR